jgi:hypothetical protein
MATIAHGSPSGTSSVQSASPLQHRALADLAGWWVAEWRRRGALPPRAAIEPCAFPRALACVWLCVYEPALGDFRVVLSGEEINDVYGLSLAGQRIGEVVAAAARGRVLARLRGVLDGPCVVHGLGRIDAVARRPRLGERLVLPLADAEGRARVVLGATRYLHPATERRLAGAGHAPGSAEAIEATAWPGVTFDSPARASERRYTPAEVAGWFT